MRHSAFASITFVISLGAGGCSTTAPADSSSLGGSGIGGTAGSADSTAGTSAGSANSSKSTSADGSDGTVKLDVGGVADDGPGDGGCKKADFLFVIDNSGSMGDEQDNLIASFSGFIEAIQKTVQAQDYHVMVVDTDATGGGSMSIMCNNGNCTCDPAPACCESACSGLGGTECNGVPCDSLPGGPCDGTLGAGKIFRHDGMLCLPDNGPRYMTNADPQLATNFACVGEVGTFGSGDEHPMEAMTQAVGPLNAAGQCNEGFVRSDAILVVTFITDEEDSGKSPGGPTEWMNQLIAAKEGNKDAIVVLGLMGDNDQPDGICEPYSDGGDGAEAGVRLRQFTEGFGERGFSGSVCADDYSPFFLEAVSIVDLACDEFVPEG